MPPTDQLSSEDDDGVPGPPDGDLLLLFSPRKAMHGLQASTKLNEQDEEDVLWFVVGFGEKIFGFFTPRLGHTRGRFLSIL